MSDPATPHPRPTDRLAKLAWLVAWGLWLRVAAADAVQWYTQRKGVLCVFPDTTIYWGLAEKLRRGEPYELTYFGALPHFAQRTPGYPLFLAACQAAFGPTVLPVRLVQSALGAGCVWLTFGLVRRALPGRCRSSETAWPVPLIAAAVVALDPFVVANSALVLSEALFLPLMLLAQWCLAALWEPSGEGADAPLTARAAAGFAALAGTATGAAVLVRPSWALYAPLALGAWVVLSPKGARRRALGRAAVVAVAAAAVMAPWWARNARVYGRFVPTALWMGASLYDGLNPRATGASDMSFLADPSVWPLDEEAQDAALRARALAFARAHPGRVAGLAAVKAARFWSPWPNAEGFRAPLLALASTALVLPQYALLALGAWDRRRDARALVLLGLPLAYTFLLHLVFVSSMRYRVPVAVPAMGLAALGLRRVLEGGWLVVGGWWLVSDSRCRRSRDREQRTDGRGHQPPTTNH
jgi:4-amino-4-deoxy-L-arabinose transferase-like glycosyltransferase